MSEATKEPGYRDNAKPGEVEKFPRTFYYANAIELFERLAHYGFYIGLALYLHKVVEMDDIEVGKTLGTFRLVGSIAPIPCGSIADRITFKRSLMLSFVGYATGYATILFFPHKAAVVAALILIAVSGGFMKPVITGTVVRTSPPGRQQEGFATFYRMVNAGSVVGKLLAYGVRLLLAIRWVAATSVIASLTSLCIATFLYEEPVDQEKKAADEKKPGLLDLLRGYSDALKDWKFSVFLVLISSYYFMIEQFYMTFPQYMTRHIDKNAPLEIITLINPATIAIAGGVITQTSAKLLKPFAPIWTNVAGVLIASTSMFAMAIVPGYWGACISAAIFAVAEMTFTPKYYDQLGTMAPKGKAGLYMGLAFVPSALGAFFGGRLSGPLIARYLPEHGDRNPFAIWSIYAGLGLGCAVLMALFGKLTSRPVVTTRAA